MAEVYRKKVTAFADALGSDNAAAAREPVRGLVDAVVLVPQDGKLRIDLRGALVNILQLASAQNAKSPGVTGAFAEQGKMVAGIGFEPMTFRL